MNVDRREFLTGGLTGILLVGMAPSIIAIHRLMPVKPYGDKMIGANVYSGGKLIYKHIFKKPIQVVNGDSIQIAVNFDVATINFFEPARVVGVNCIDGKIADAIIEKL